VGGGHGLISATQLARPVTRSSLRLCSCGLIHMYYLGVSFSYLRSAAGVSFVIKKACRKPYNTKFFFIAHLSRHVSNLNSIFIVTLQLLGCIRYWCPSLLVFGAKIAFCVLCLKNFISIHFKLDLLAKEVLESPL
jgi:hypothetical protein